MARAIICVTTSAWPSAEQVFIAGPLAEAEHALKHAGRRVLTNLTNSSDERPIQSTPSTLGGMSARPTSRFSRLRSLFVARSGPWTKTASAPVLLRGRRIVPARA